MTLIITTAVFSVLFVALGFYIHSGKGWWLIAGYNMSSKNERGKYDEKALCKFIGKVVITIGVLLIPLGIKSVVGWYWIAFTVLVLAIGIFASVYSNTGNRFKKVENND